MYWTNNKYLCALIAASLLVLGIPLGCGASNATLAPEDLLGPKPGVTYLLSDLGWQQTELVGKSWDADGVLHVQSKTTYKKVKDPSGNPLPPVVMIGEICFFTRNNAVIMQRSNKPPITLLELGSLNWTSSVQRAFRVPVPIDSNFMPIGEETVIIHCELRSKSKRMLFGQERLVLATACRVPVGIDGETETHFYELAEGLGLVKEAVFSDGYRPQSIEAVVEIKQDHP
ncbi:MAG: hypothetical protein AB7E47_00305 [Desulfovibrionaceae bacterium]